MRALRILPDVNVLVSFELSRAAGKSDTVIQRLVNALLGGTLGNQPAQLVISTAMLDSFRDVMLRLGAAPENIAAANRALIDLTQRGPHRLDPFLLLDRSEIRFPLRDREDAAVLATAFAARADLLVTDNLSDFASKDCTIAATSRARHSTGAVRQLSCQFHRAPDGHVIVVAHPLDVVLRAAQGTPLLFDELRGSQFPPKTQ